MQTIRKPFSAYLIFLCVTFTGPGFAATPSGWTEKVQTVHGVIVKEMKGPGGETSAPQLIELQFFIPVAIADLSGLMQNFIDGANVDIVATLEADLQSVVEHRSFTNTYLGGPLARTELIAFIDGPLVKLVAFSAMPDEFDRLGGRDFLAAQLLGAPSMEQFVDTRRTRRALIEGTAPGSKLGVNKNGTPFTQADFAMSVEIAQLLGGVRLSAAQVETLKSDMLGLLQEDDNWRETRASLQTFLKELKEVDSLRAIKVVEQVYAQAWKGSQSATDPDPVFDMVLKTNPVQNTAGDAVLSERAMEARLNSVRLLLDWSGIKGAKAEARLRKARQELKHNFRRYPEKSRQRAAAAQSRWLRLWAASHNWDAKRKQQAVSQAAIWSNNNPSDVIRAEKLEEEAYKATEQNALISIIRMQGILDGYAISGALNF